MIAPLVVVGEVIGALKHEMEIVAIVHRGLTEAQHSRRESIAFSVVIVSTVGGSESESVHDVELQFEATIHHVTHHVVFHCCQHSIGVFSRDTVVGVALKLDAVCLIHIHRG